MLVRIRGKRATHYVCKKCGILYTKHAGHPQQKSAVFTIIVAWGVDRRAHAGRIAACVTPPLARTVIRLDRKGEGGRGGGERGGEREGI